MYMHCAKKTRLERAFQLIYVPHGYNDRTEGNDPPPPGMIHVPSLALVHTIELIPTRNSPMRTHWCNHSRAHLLHHHYTISIIVIN